MICPPSCAPPPAPVPGFKKRDSITSVALVAKF